MEEIEWEYMDGNFIWDDLQLQQDLSKIKKKILFSY